MHLKACAVWMIVYFACSFAVPAQSIEDKERLFPLVDAVSCNKTNALQRLLSKGVAVNERFGPRKETVLFRAALWGHLEVTRMLIEAGADPLIQDAEGNLPFHYAVAKNHKAVAEILLAKGSKFDAKNLFGQTPLLMAAQEGSEDTALWLLDLGADPNACGTNSSETAVYYAVFNGKKSLANALLKKGARTNVKGLHNGWTPLHVAVIQGDINTVDLLLKRGCAVDPVDDEGMTPLLLGIYQGQGNQSVVIDRLVSAGADIRKQDKFGRAAVDLAAKRIKKMESRKYATEELREAEMTSTRALLPVVQRHAQKKEGATDRQ